MIKSDVVKVLAFIPSRTWPVRALKAVLAIFDVAEDFSEDLLAIVFQGAMLKAVKDCVDNELASQPADLESLPLP